MAEREILDCVFYSSLIGVIFRRIELDLSWHSAVSGLTGFFYAPVHSGDNVLYLPPPKVPIVV